MTPTMPAGLTDRLWSMEDVVAMLDAPEAPAAKRGHYKPRQPRAAENSNLDTTRFPLASIRGNQYPHPHDDERH